MESLQGRQIRADLARSGGQRRLEPQRIARRSGLSLEEIFLQLTAAETRATRPRTKQGRNKAMKQRAPDLQERIQSYFTSPIAYLLMAFFGLIFGFGLYTATRDVVRMGFCRRR